MLTGYFCCPLWPIKKRHVLHAFYSSICQGFPEKMHNGLSISIADVNKHGFYKEANNFLRLNLLDYHLLKIKLQMFLFVTFIPFSSKCHKVVPYKKSVYSVTHVRTDLRLELLIKKRVHHNSHIFWIFYRVKWHFSRNLDWRKLSNLFFD